MKNLRLRLRQIPIVSYLMIMLVAAVVPALVTAYLSRTKADAIQQKARNQAIERAYGELLRELRDQAELLQSIARRLSAWDETNAQFRDPTYYKYWKQTRVQELVGGQGGILDAIDLYKVDGSALVKDSVLGPRFISGATRMAKVIRIGGRNFLVYFHPNHQKTGNNVKLLGYIGVRFDVDKMIKHKNALARSSIQKLKWNLQEGKAVSVLAAVRGAGLTITPATEIKLLVKLVRTSYWEYLIYVFTLLVTFGILLMYFIARPLSKLTGHLQQLDAGTLDSIPDDVYSTVRIKELEDVCQALNDYKARFQVATANLEQTNKELLHLTYHDPLTGCANRRAFERRLSDAMKQVERDNKQHALCYLDVDQFKVVNDTCGHVAGDELLKQVASLLEGEIRGADLLARLGGDEFGVLLENCNVEDALQIGESMRLRIKGHHFVWQGQPFDISVSIGMVPINGETGTMSEVLKNADAACYVAKDGGRNRLHLYQEDDSELAQRYGEMQWVNRIRHALDNDRFELYGQSIMPLSDPSTEPHYEVLLRLRDDDELILPMAFIPAAERYNLMTEIDTWVICNALKILSQEKGNAGESPVFSINLSGQSIGKEEVLECIQSNIFKYHIDPSKLCFEITETAAISNLSQAVEFIRFLRDLGCMFSLDDFGSGLSSFSYLVNLEVDSIKIDGYFIKNMYTDPLSRTIITTISQIGRQLGIRTIAEFVESRKLLEDLRELKVGFAQGFGLHEPVPLQELIKSPEQPRIFRGDLQS